MLENFGYSPYTRGGRIRKQFRFGEYLAIIVSDFDPIENEEDEIEYIFVMAVYKMPKDQIRLFVTSEMSAGARNIWAKSPELSPGEDVAFLGLFLGVGHSNLGMSSDWTDLDKFTTKALDVASEQLNVREQAIEDPV